LSSHSGDSFKVVAYLIIGGGTVLYRGMRRWRSRKDLLDTPASTLRSAPQGLAQVTGYALAIAKAFSTLDGRPAAFRRTKIQVYESHGKNSSWVTRLEETEGARILFSDGTGLAEVDTTDAELILRERVFNWSSLATKTRERLLQEYGNRVTDLRPSSGGWWSNLSRKSVRFVESAIPLGAPVTVRGDFRSPADPLIRVLTPQTYRFLGRIAEFRNDPAKMRRAFDRNRDGKISEDELYSGSQKIYEGSSGDVQGEDYAERVRLQGGFKQDPVHRLIIGDARREGLAARQDWGFAMMVVGVGLIAVGLGLGTYLVTNPGR